MINGDLPVIKITDNGQKYYINVYGVNNLIYNGEDASQGELICGYRIANALGNPIDWTITSGNMLSDNVKWVLENGSATINNLGGAGQQIEYRLQCYIKSWWEDKAGDYKVDQSLPMMERYGVKIGIGPAF
jgi:hypothetical protein